MRNICKLCIKIEEILECPKFSTLHEVYQRPFDNILSFEDVDIEWEYGRSQICADLQSKIDEMYIRNGRKEYELEPAEAIKFWQRLRGFWTTMKK